MHLQPHVLASGNLSCLQSVYRPGYSTETALPKVVGDNETAAGNRMRTALLALDISELLLMQLVIPYSACALSETSVSRAWHSVG